MILALDTKAYRIHDKKGWFISKNTAEENADGTSVWYDLQGRRLESKPKKKGVYIRDGKKVVTK